MSDMKTCPFCLEDIPVRAIKCRFCESMVDDIKPEASPASIKAEPVTKEQKKRDTPQQGVYYQAVSEKKKGKRFLVPLIIILAFLLVLGAGAAYWFLWRDGGAPTASGGLAGGDLVGDAWQGLSGGEEVYFQFLPNEMANVAVPSEGYWFRTQYRIVDGESKSFLELYHRGLAEWERTAELAFLDPDTLTMIDQFAGIQIELERIPNDQFRDVINDLRFER